MTVNVSATHTSALPVESNAVIMLQITPVHVVENPAFIETSAAITVVSSLLTPAAQSVAATIVEDVAGFPLVSTWPAPTVAHTIVPDVAGLLPTTHVKTATTIKVA